MKDTAKKKMGLTHEEVERSRSENGKNRLSQAKTKSFLCHFIGNLGDPVIKILLAALVINLFFVFRGGDIIETVGIAISVFLATLISTLSERGSDAAFRKLSEECERAEYRVIREGRAELIPIEEIVVGDLLLLQSGESVPADAYLLEGELSVDQSAMTGEGREISKYPSASKGRTPDCPNAIFKGSVVISGEASCEVFAVGDNTFLGNISSEIQMSKRQSPLKIRLTKLAKQISRLGYIAAILISVAYLFNSFVVSSAYNPTAILLKIKNTPFLLRELLHSFMLGLTVIVVAVPEGLPMMIAVVLSSNIRRMIKDNVLVRTPAGIEAAGSMNILFTDKTGTLTEGKMSVERFILGDLFEASSYRELLRSSEPISELYLNSCIYNTESFIGGGKKISGGNATERALLASIDGYAPKKSDKAIKAGRKIRFDSTIKYSAVEINGKKAYHLIKGAPEKLLPSISKYYEKDGKTKDFSDRRSEFSSLISSLAKSGKRLLIIAESDQFPTPSTLGELTLICAVAISDKIRNDAPNAVRELKRAGVQVVMITGDGKDTAEAVAIGCGITDKAQSLIINASQMSSMSDSELSEILPRIAVISRALPSDKSRLVKIAQEKDLVVGMTGDGINDAPALKRSDVGFAMGNGTGVAKAAGDIIILDNRLSSIAKAVLYGRNIFKSIRKFITLQLTMNFSAVGVSMICPFLGFPAPVTVVQMLWINIIMDTLGGLAFAGEAPLASSMKEAPKKRDEPILNSYMVNQIVFLGGFTILLCLFFLLTPDISCAFRYAPDNIYLLTAFFALFIFTSVFNCFSARSDRLMLFSGISKNKAFVIIMSAILITQIFFVYLGGTVLRTAPLLPKELFFTFLLSLSVFPADILRKILWRAFGNKKGF